MECYDPKADLTSCLKGFPTKASRRPRTSRLRADTCGNRHRPAARYRRVYLDRRAARLDDRVRDRDARPRGLRLRGARARGAGARVVAGPGAGLRFPYHGDARRDAAASATSRSRSCTRPVTRRSTSRSSSRQPASRRACSPATRCLSAPSAGRTSSARLRHAARRQLYDSLFARSSRSTTTSRCTPGTAPDRSAAPASAGAVIRRSARSADSIRCCSSRPRKPSSRRCSRSARDAAVLSRA